MALTVNTNIINDTDQYLLDAKNVKGGYVVVTSAAERDELPAATTVKGSLCYVTGTAADPINKFYQYNGTAWVEKTFGTTTDATTSSAGLMSAEDKAKLDGIATNANKYEHPDTHAASMITGLATVATSGSYNDLSNRPNIDLMLSAKPDYGTVEAGGIAYYDNNLDISTVKCFKVLSPESKEPLLEQADANWEDVTDFVPGAIWMKDKDYNMLQITASGFDYQTDVVGPHKKFNFPAETLTGNGGDFYNYTIATREWAEDQLTDVVRLDDIEYATEDDIKALWK